MLPDKDTVWPTDREEQEFILYRQKVLKMSVQLKSNRKPFRYYYLLDTITFLSVHQTIGLLHGDLNYQAYSSCSWGPKLGARDVK